VPVERSALRRIADATQAGGGSTKGPLLGVAFGLCSFALRFSQLRPNRIASGTGVPAWEILTLLEMSLLLFPLAVCLFLSLRPGGRRPSSSRALPLACGISGNFLVCLVFYLSGKAARILVSPETPNARVSMGLGAWMMVLAGYVFVLFALEDGSMKKHEKALFSLGGAAVLLAFTAAGFLDGISVLREFDARSDRFLGELASHLLIAGTSVGAAVIIGIPLGVVAFRKRLAERPVFFAVNTVQTIPSLALFGLLIAPLAYLSRTFPLLRRIGISGVGAAPAFVALTLYSLLPIVRNTYTSLKVIDPGIPEAGKGMGMGRVQLLLRVEVPISLPIILSGIRVSLVQAIGNTTVAALIGAGGLGVFVFQGLGQAVPDLILLGVIPVICLAIITDRVMQAFVRLITPKGLSQTAGGLG